MSTTEMTKEGIQIEKLSLTWVQIVGAAFSLGVAYAAIFYVYGLSIENRTILDSRAQYIPRLEQMEKMVMDSNKLNQELNSNVIKLNSNLETINILRERDDRDSNQLQSAVKSLENSVSDLKMKTIQLESQLQNTRFGKQHDTNFAND